MKLLISLFVLFVSIRAAALTPEKVVRSSMNHFPKVIVAIQDLEVSSNQVTQAQGAFDGALKGEVNARVDGYYEGDIYKLKVEKPIPFLNSKIYGGHRQSYSDFPSYEGKLRTADRGENFVGVSLSLLRDSLIDQNRYNIWYLEQNKEIARKNLDAVKINVQTMALKAYWTWVVKGQELKVYEEILNLANSRAEQLQKRIRAGDLARIYASENNQYILKRQSQVQQKKMEFREAAYYLSLFYRDQTGKPVSITINSIPEVEKLSLSKISKREPVIQRSLKENIQLKILEAKASQANLEIRLGRNHLLPKLDVKYEWSQDRGTSPDFLIPEENRIMLSLEVPFQYRKGLGKKSQGEAKLERIKAKQKWQQEKIQVEVKTYITNLNAFADIFEITQKQIKLANELAEAEKKKFARGASDLILVNIREENLAEAQVKNLSSLLEYRYIDAELLNLQMHFVSR